MIDPEPTKFLGIALMYQIFYIFGGIFVVFAFYKIIDIGMDLFKSVFFRSNRNIKIHD